MMTIRQVARCPICGNIVEVLHAGAGTLVCCGQPMQLLEANTTDAAQEKHVPVIERVDGGYRVTVGSVEHPMTPEHHKQRHTSAQKQVAASLDIHTNAKLDKKLRLRGVWRQ